MATKNKKLFGFDHFYRNEDNNKIRTIAKVNHKTSGRCLKILSD